MGAAAHVHRCDLVEMFGGEHLDGVIQRDSRTHCVCARGFFAPQGAFHEAHLVRRARANPRVALDPQQPAVLVGDDHQVLGFVSDLSEQSTQSGREAPQRMLGPDVPDLIPRHHRQRGTVRSVEARRGAALPRFGDRRSQIRRW